MSPGDTVGEWRVVAAELRPVDGLDSSWVGEVRFRGRVELTGARRPHPSDPELEAVCFFPDSLSSARLPRLAGDERVSWFCFDNPGAAVALDPAPASPSAQTITIDEYRYIVSFSDVFNTARLASVDPDPGDSPELSLFAADKLVTGRVVENVTACEVDADCYLRIEFSDTSIIALYGIGERPAPRCEIPRGVTDAAFRVERGEILRLVVALCEGDGLSIRRITREGRG